jgi:hypothetical protein
MDRMKEYDALRDPSAASYFSRCVLGQVYLPFLSSASMVRCLAVLLMMMPK